MVLDLNLRLSTFSIRKVRSVRVYNSIAIVMITGMIMDFDR